jgi:hypothetical protein
VEERESDIRHALAFGGSMTMPGGNPFPLTKKKAKKKSKAAKTKKTRKKK